MSEEIIEDMLEEVAPQIAGDYPEIAQRYKAGEELTDEEIDTIADVAISILRSILSHFDAANSPIEYRRYILLANRGAYRPTVCHRDNTCCHREARCMLCPSCLHLGRT